MTRPGRLPFTAIVGVSVLAGLAGRQRRAAVASDAARRRARGSSPSSRRRRRPERRHRPAPPAERGTAPAPAPPAPAPGRRRRFWALLLVWVPLAAIVAAGLLVRLWHLNSLGYNSDEAVYGGQGAALAHDPTLSPYFPTFRAHPLLFQMLLSVGYHLGIGEIFGRLAAVGLGILTILVVVRVGDVLYGRKAGLLAALVIALMPYHVVVTRQVLLDGPMVLGATVTLLAVARFAATQRPVWLSRRARRSG